MQRSESRRKAALSNFSDEGIEGQLGKILGEFRRKTNGIRGSVIADGNGLTVASDIQGAVSPAVLSAMSTLIAQSGARVFENIEMAGPSFIIMDGDQANVAVVQFAAGDVSLLTLIDRSANLGVLKIEMKRTAAKIAEALGIAFGTSTGISELFIITKGGILIRHYSDTLRTDLDRDILSGMLVAVQEFVKQTRASIRNLHRPFRPGAPHDCGCGREGYGRRAREIRRERRPAGLRGPVCENPAYMERGRRGVRGHRRVFGKGAQGLRLRPAGRTGPTRVPCEAI